LAKVKKTFEICGSLEYIYISPLKVKAKKHLGQHFLSDENIAHKISNSLVIQENSKVLEIGPGTGMLTKYLLDKNYQIFVSEIDKESVEFLELNYPKLSGRIFGDFIKLDIPKLLGEDIAIIGNFPYNISSQILFKIIDSCSSISQVVGMFQKEVAERVSASSRTKDYGILSVMVQAYYDVKYLFTVSENVFIPPPKVKSGVIRMIRNKKYGLEGNEITFKNIVKSGFNQRRKTLKNAWKSLNFPENIINNKDMQNFLNMRAEELSVYDFILVANILNNHLNN